MCSTPKIPPPPPPPQEAKAPDTINSRRKARNPMQGGTLLTSPSGVAAGSLNTGGATLLGQ